MHSNVLRITFAATYTAINMKHFIIISLLLLALPAYSQDVTQTVRGTVMDADSRTPLIGVSVSIPGTSPLKGTSTDEHGAFTLPGVSLGRITLVLRYIGYKETTIPNIVVDAGKEVVLELLMEESANKLNEVVIRSNQVKGAVQNEMSLVSGRSISLEETKRYAGGFNDPARILANFAGVTNNPSGDNEVIVRGNSPKYVQWRLEGIEITNPNHFADQNAIAGGISGLNNNLLAASDFYTGAFAPEYGDALSGVYDLKFRNGNNQRFESILGIGILGTELTLEGPFKKRYNGSFLANYRYSSIGLVSDLGLTDIEFGVPKFQDGAFKIVLPTKKFGSFSLFGLNGLSSLAAEDVTPALFPAPTNESADSTLRRDYKKTTYFLNFGISHHLPLNARSYLTTALTYSANGINEKIFASDVFKVYDGNGNFLRDSISQRRETYSSKLDNLIYRASITYNNKISARNRIQAGVRYAGFIYRYDQSVLQDSLGNRLLLAGFNEQIGTVRSFVSWKHRLNNRFTFVTGLHNVNVLYNRKSTIEPRFALNWTISGKSAVSIGYGKHSKMESVHHYFAKVKQPDGSYLEPNKNLGLLKAHHIVAGYEYRFTANLRAKAEVYYQYLYNLPVQNTDTSYYATINEGINFEYVELVNKGTGHNYGLEITIERFFHRNYYFLINASVYQSKYEAMDGRLRNTAYADNYLLNVLCGKEFTGLGKKDNQVLSLNATFFYGGGKKYIPLLRNTSGDATGPYYDYRNAYQNKLDDIYRLTISASYKWNRRKSTHELFLNMDNITNRTGRVSEYYDASEARSTAYFRQIGFFPNLMYRLYL
jgi:hypothetical protein